MTGDPQVEFATSTLGLYERLVADLETGGARYRLIDHAPEGRTDLVSALRGHDVALAAKCLIVMVKIGKKQSRYVLAVVPGDARVDLHAVRALVGGTYVAFAGKDKAEELAGSVSGTVLPFSYHPGWNSSRIPRCSRRRNCSSTPRGSTARSRWPPTTTPGWPCLG